MHCSIISRSCCYLWYIRFLTLKLFCGVWLVDIFETPAAAAIVMLSLCCIYSVHSLCETLKPPSLPAILQVPDRYCGLSSGNQFMHGTGILAQEGP